MDRLIDFHTNCSCGRDVHAALDLVDDDVLQDSPNLLLHVQTDGTSVLHRVPVSKVTSDVDVRTPSDDGKQGNGRQRPAQPQRGTTQPTARTPKGGLQSA